MILILELEPEVEQRLEREAAEAGIAVEAWALQLLKRVETPIGKLDQAEIERRLKLMDESVAIAREFSKGTEPLSDYAISREAIYGEYELERNS